MIVKNLGILVTPGFRCKAYLQNLVKNKLLPEFAIIIDGKNVIYHNEFNSIFSIDHAKKYFDLFEDALTTIKKNGIPFKIIDAKTPNEKGVIEELLRRKEKYYIYTGGGILKKDTLKTGKKFIHIHPGIIPKYRGSTCFYYSILIDDNCGATAFFMEEGVDTGRIIMQKSFKKPNLIDLDNIFDPYMRSELLVDVIKRLKKYGRLPSKKQNLNEGETYFIIHPVLKHLAILSCTNDEKHKTIS